VLHHARTLLLVACALLGVLTGCASSPHTDATVTARVRASESLWVKGALSYRAVMAEQRIELRGRQVMQDVSGEPVAQASCWTLKFGADGRVSGKTFCNSDSGNYALTGEALTFSTLVSTRMACVQPLMSQEERFLAVAKNTSRFEMGSHGSLVLHARDGRMIKARRVSE